MCKSSAAHPLRNLWVYVSFGASLEASRADHKGGRKRGPRPGRIPSSSAGVAAYLDMGLLPRTWQHLGVLSGMLVPRVVTYLS